MRCAERGLAISCNLSNLSILTEASSPGTVSMGLPCALRRCMRLPGCLLNWTIRTQLNNTHVPYNSNTKRLQKDSFGGIQKPNTHSEGTYTIWRCSKRWMQNDCQEKSINDQYCFLQCSSSHLRTKLQRTVMTAGASHGHRSPASNCEASYYHMSHAIVLHDFIILISSWFHESKDVHQWTLEKCAFRVDSTTRPATPRFTPP